VIAARRIARPRVATPRAVTRSAPLVRATNAVPKAASIIAIISARIAPA